MTVKLSVPTSEKSAAAHGMFLPISMKAAVEICGYLRGKKLARAKTILENVIAEKQPIPYTRFNGDVGHRKGNIAAGRYPIKACTEILTVVKSAEANAQFKGLLAKDLVLKQICAKQGGKQYRYGRHRGRRAKRTHIEVVVEEKK
ncbi:50S ribosomal protein L22 [Candidatus Woesearchaeota archaeon]|nr:50S ribosomal protein L22 [Candidatus Woesearchaeota archaeon]